MQIPVNSSSLSKDFTDQTASIIFDCTGQKGYGSSIYKLGNQKLGSWDATLKNSGFWLSEIRRSGSPCERNQDKIVEMIRLFHKNDIALNRSAMIKRSNQIKFLIEEKFGPSVSGCSVMGAAEELFGSWDKALWEAGLDVGAIRLRSRPHSFGLATTSFQLEDVKRDGEFGRVKYLGDPSKSPEELMQEQESADELQLAVNNIKDDDRELTERIFEAILQIHHYKDQNQLISFIVQHLDHEVTENKVREIFSQLLKNLPRSH